MIWPWNRDEPRAELRSAGEAARAIGDLIAALPDPCLVLDGDGTIVASNPPSREALGLDPARMHLSSAIRAPAVLTALDDMFETGMARSADYDVRAPVPRHFEVSISPMGEHASGALVLMRDITREHRVERLRADFVANASHELRTPLASLLGFIETLQGPARDDARAREKFLALMKTQAERMSRLIGDLLSLSRVEMNEHVRPGARADLAQAARHVCDVLAPMAKEAGTRIEIDLPDAMAVSGDRDELVQVIQNLIENAIKYASAGKVVRIVGSVENGGARLSVIDEGPGIAQEHVPRLTERFYRVSAQDSRLRGGTGLGLAIVKHILNRHGARLEIASQVGRGSTFTIRMSAI